MDEDKSCRVEDSNMIFKKNMLNKYRNCILIILRRNIIEITQNIYKCDGLDTNFFFRFSPTYPKILLQETL